MLLVSHSTHSVHLINVKLMIFCLVKKSCVSEKILTMITHSPTKRAMGYILRVLNLSYVLVLCCFNGMLYWRMLWESTTNPTFTSRFNSCRAYKPCCIVLFASLCESDIVFMAAGHCKTEDTWVKSDIKLLVLFVLLFTKISRHISRPETVFIDIYQLWSQQG